VDSSDLPKPPLPRDPPNLGSGDVPLRRDEVGRWYSEPTREATVLHGASEMPLFFAGFSPAAP